MLPLLLPGSARLFYPLSPDVSMSDRIAVDNVVKISNFLTGKRLSPSNAHTECWAIHQCEAASTASASLGIVGTGVCLCVQSIVPRQLVSGLRPLSTTSGCCA